MTVDKKQLFKTAWGLAKNAAWREGGRLVGAHSDGRRQT